MSWYMQALKKYAVFAGRARRKEFWMFFLVYVLIVVVLMIVESILGLPGILSGIYSLALLIPSIAVTVRRLHDTGRTGWWWWLGFVPVIGIIVLLVFMALEGEPGQNGYGPDPKAAYRLAVHAELESPSAWVVRWAPRVMRGPVLDLACGGGRHSRFFRDL